MSFSLVARQDACSRPFIAVTGDGFRAAHKLRPILWSGSAARSYSSVFLHLAVPVILAADLDYAWTGTNTSYDRNEPKLFAAGFALSAHGFVAANIVSFLTIEPPCCDLLGPFGFPLPLGEFGGFVGQTHMLWSGLIANVVVGLVASIVFGWAFQKALPRLVAGAVDMARWHVSTRL